MKETHLISFVQDGRIRTIDLVAEGLSPTMTVLNYLRLSPGHRGTKEGCAEGDCGACTVVLGEPADKEGIRYTAIDSCLVFLPMLHGKQLITVENLSKRVGQDALLHPVQQAMVDHDGSQCGFCTPGIVMSLFALYKKDKSPEREEVLDALTGNLCRCTGYRPIMEAAVHACAHPDADSFTSNETKIREMLLQISTQFPSVHINATSQQYARPGSLPEALKIKSTQPDVLVINGATDVALRVTKKHELLQNLLDLSAVAELKRLEITPEEIVIGAGCHLEEIKNTVENELPALHHILSVFGSRQIRSLATLGGNIGSASPIGDTLPVLMAYDAKVVLQNFSGQRVVAIREFITGYRQTQISKDELIVAVRIPRPDPGTFIRSYKVSKRKDLDISTVNGGFCLKVEDGLVREVLLAFGGMAATTSRAKKTEEFLSGKKWNQETVDEAAALLYQEFNPISDARSGAEFRRIAAGNLLIRFFSEHQHLQ